MTITSGKAEGNWQFQAHCGNRFTISHKPINNFLSPVRTINLSWKQEKVSKIVAAIRCVIYLSVQNNFPISHVQIFLKQQTALVQRRSP